MKLPIKSKILIISFLILAFSVYTYNTIQKNSTPITFSQETIASTDLENQLNEVEKKLAEVRKKQQDLESIYNSEAAKQSQYGEEIAKLSGEISLKANRIAEITLDIEKLHLQVEILEFTIDETEKDIEETEDNIDQLEEDTQERLVSLYLDMKSYSDAEIIFNPQTSSQFVKNDLYQKSVQEDTNSSLSELDKEREDLKVKEVKLSEDKIQIEKDKTQFDEQKIALEKEKTVLDQTRGALNQKIAESLNQQKQVEFAYEQSSESEKKLLAEQEYIKQQLLETIGTIPSNSYVLRGTAIGIEGSTGWSTGPHLHFGVTQNGVTKNPCDFLNCGGVSDGQLKWPISPAGQITSGFGYREYDYHPAIDISNGGGSRIIAAHDGWITYGKNPCYDLSWVKCNGGFAYYAIICEDRNNCSNGFSTIYYHLKYQ